VVVVGRGALVVDVAGDVVAAGVVVVVGRVVVVVGRVVVVVGGLVVGSGSVSTTAVVSVTVEFVAATDVRPAPSEHAATTVIITRGRRSRRLAIAP
jgi:hypothetical protein